MKRIIIFLICLTPLLSFSQKSVAELSAEIPKGQLAILEVRLNMEDEFRTMEGRDSQGLARITLYTGENKNEELISKGFEGYNHVVQILNEMKENGWELEESYPIRGNSLIITHYIFEKVKK